MADTVAFELVTPARLVLSQAVEMVVVPGGEGDFGVLPGHAPLISTVRPGVVDIHNGGKITQRIFIAGGFAEVGEDRCTVLAEEAMAVEDIDRNKAEARVEAARAALEKAQEGIDRTEAGHELSAAEAMLAAAEGGPRH
ncbi:MAG: F0F1 ATP synthase subunit epsilon [Rhodobacterales bacterium]|nr:F0F1 ATP synthase subunit epsilon [Rhodobacterales bacterium]